MPSVREVYEAELAARDYQSDPAQLRALTDVVAGHLPAMFALFGDALLQAQNGAIRLVAVSSEQRSVQAPDVPTVAESGFPGFEAITLFGLIAQNMPAALTNVGFVGVFWPSIWFPDPPDAGANGVAAAVSQGKPGAADAALSGAQIAAALKPSFDDQDSRDALDAMGSLIDDGFLIVVCLQGHESPVHEIGNAFIQ